MPTTRLVLWIPCLNPYILINNLLLFDYPLHNSNEDPTTLKPIKIFHLISQEPFQSTKDFYNKSLEYKAS